MYELEGPLWCWDCFISAQCLEQFVPMVHVHEGKVGAQDDEYFASRSSR